MAGSVSQWVAHSPAQHAELLVLSPAPQSWAQGQLLQSQEHKVTLGCVGSSRPAWAMRASLIKTHCMSRVQTIGLACARPPSVPSVPPLPPCAPSVPPLFPHCPVSPQCPPTVPSAPHLPELPLLCPCPVGPSRRTVTTAESLRGPGAARTHCSSQTQPHSAGQVGVGSPEGLG